MVFQEQHNRILLMILVSVIMMSLSSSFHLKGTRVTGVRTGGMRETELFFSRRRNRQCCMHQKHLISYHLSPSLLSSLSLFSLSFAYPSSLSLLSSLRFSLTPLALSSLSRLSICSLSLLFPVSFMSIVMASNGLDKHVSSVPCSECPRDEIQTKRVRTAVSSCGSLSRSHMNGKMNFPLSLFTILRQNCVFLRFSAPYVASKRPRVCVCVFKTPRLDTWAS